MVLTPVTGDSSNERRRKDYASRLERTIPVCPYLFSSNPDFQSSGLRLSWPIPNDGRRAIVGKPPRPKTKDRHGANVHIVPVTCGDIKIHRQFTVSMLKGLVRPELCIPLAWNPSNVNVKDKDLFQYFLKSLLAFSALHRHSVNSQAGELKISALNALVASSRRQIDPKEAIQHIAAGMLLCSYEIHQASCTSSQWTWYLDGVKDVIKASYLDNRNQDTDLAILLDWVYYHDVLARFTLRHWRRESPGTPSPLPSLRAEASHTAPPVFAMLALLSDICDSTETSAASEDDRRSFLEILDWRIRSLTVASMVRPNDSIDSLLTMELYQLVMLIYLNRASRNLLNKATRMQQQISKAFAILPQLSRCDRQFPVFVLGCEARMDEQREAVLDLISRTEKGISSRSFNHVKILLQSIWAQDDLADQEISYWDKLSHVISCCSIMPTFV